MKLLRKFFHSASQGFGLFRALAPVRSMLRDLRTIGPLRILRSVPVFLLGVFWGIVRGIAALDLRLFLQGLPALAAGGATLTIAVIVMSTRAQDLEARYAERAKAAASAKD